MENVNIINNTVYKEVVVSKTNNEQKNLGMLWDEIEDNAVLRLVNTFKNTTYFIPTERNLLSVISTVYDQVECLQAFTIQLKIMFQRIGKFDIDWDDSIDEFSVEWKKICRNLKRCEEIAIKSYFIYDISDTIEEVFWMLRNQLTQHAFIYNQ